MQTKNLAAWGRNPATGKLQWDADVTWPAGLVADFRFFLHDNYESVKNGVSWTNTGRVVNTPLGQSEKGGRYFYQGNLNPSISSNKTDEQRFSFGQIGEFWIKRRLFIPSNFYIRNIIFLTITTSIVGWEVGDTAKGSDGVSLGTIVFISGSVVYLDYADSFYSDMIWIGVITNTTRATTATSISRGFFDNGNKHFVLYCDGYDTSGKSPTIVFGLRGASKTGDVDMDFSIAVDGYGTGQQPATQSSSVKFFTAADNGHHVDIVYHVRMSTNEFVNDGVVEVWRKRDNEPTYIKKLASYTMNLGARTAATPSLCMFKGGYCFGWSNSGFNTDTEFHESRFMISSTAIDGVE